MYQHNILVENFLDCKMSIFIFSDTYKANCPKNLAAMLIYKFSFKTGYTVLKSINVFDHIQNLQNK